MLFAVVTLSVCMDLFAEGCFSGAYSATTPQNISIDGISTPIRLLHGDWAAARLVAEVVALVLRHELGFNTELGSIRLIGSAYVWMATADCTQFDPQKSCNPGRAALNGHLAFDVWESYSAGVIPRLLADVREQFPIRVPYPQGVGYTGTEGMFVRKPIVHQALAQHVSLEWHQVYNSSWNLTWPFFASHLSLPVPDISCIEVPTLSSEYLMNYINVTGDGDVAGVESGQLVPLCHSNWLLSKTCRERIKNGGGCTSLVSIRGYGYSAFLQFAFWHDMPIALGSYSTTRWLEVSRNQRVIFYCWQPDIQCIRLNPKEIQFPLANVDEHNLGIYRTTVEGSRIYNLANAAVPKAEPLLMKFMENFHISIHSITAMLREFDQRSPSEVACRWLRDNQDSWKRWIPDLRCDSGQGMERDRQTGRSYCRWCTAGKSSFNQRCEKCKPGRYQELVAQSECVACESGKYAAGRGRTACRNCEPGSYGPISGSSSCTDCNRSSTTRFFGSASLDDCVCEQGTYFDQGDNLCMPCSQLAPIGLVCPGGHAVFSSQSIDATVRLQPGYMSLAKEPFVVYTCVGMEVRCPGERVLGNDTNMCSGGYDPSAARCSRCKRSFYQFSQNSCHKCSRSDAFGIVFVGKCVLGLALELIAVTYLYFRFNRPNPSGLITLSLLVTYIQMVHQIAKLPLKWQNPLLGIFTFLDYFSIQGYLGLLSLRTECVAGSSLWTDLVADLLAPPTLFFHLALAWLSARLIRRPLIWDYVLNTMGLIVKGIFLTIASMPLRLFVAERMPGGQLMVKTLPDIRVGSAEWLQAVPVAIVAFMAYCISFMAYVAYAVVKAPRWAASWPAFQLRYRFAFGVLRPDRWWWSLVQLCFGLGIMTVQVATHSAHYRIYGMIVLVEIYTIACFQVYPYRFLKNNHVELTLQCSLLIFLVIATSFLEPTSLPRQELEQMRDGFGIFITLVLAAAVLHALQGFAAWLLATIFPATKKRAQVYKHAMDFRDLAVDICLLPHSDFMNAVESLSEVDQCRLRDATLSLVPTFLKLQPAPKWWKQRLIPDVPFAVWDRLQMTMRALHGAVDSSGQAMLAKNAVARLQLMILADEVRRHKKDCEDIKTRHRDTLQVMTNGTCESTNSNSKISLPNKANESQFCEALTRHSSLTEDELKNVFKLIKFGGHDHVSLLELTVALVAGAPRLSEEQAIELRRLYNELQPAPKPAQPQVRESFKDDANSDDETSVVVQGNSLESI